MIGVFVDPDVSTQPWFFLGETCHLTDLGGGCWTLGVTVTECANSKFADEVEVLKPLVPVGRKGHRVALANNVTGAPRGRTDYRESALRPESSACPAADRTRRTPCVVGSSS